MNDKTTFSAAAVRADYLKRIQEFFTNSGEDALLVKSGTIAIPVVDANGVEGWVTVAVSVPKGSRDGEPFDGYELAEDFAFEQSEKEKKKAEEAAKREKKKAKDAAAREEKKRLREAKKAEREAATN